jgi:hypothetical protein
VIHYLGWPQSLPQQPADGTSIFAMSVPFAQIDGEKVS